MRILAVVSIFLFAFLLQSCKEGCKDKNAINYDSRAKVENGTCLYCSGSSSRDTATYFFTEPNSPNPNTNAVEFIVISTNVSQWGNGCQTEGKLPGSQCKNYLSVVNLVNENMEGFAEVQFTQNDTSVWFFNSQQFTLNAPGSGFDTLNFGLVDSFGCSNLITGTLNLDNNNFEWFP